MNNPYRGLPAHQFWRSGVSAVERFRFDPVVSPRFSVSASDRVATGGSCFAQHLSNRLARIGFNYFVAEAGDELEPAERTERGYGLFSCRYGNIYTTRQLLQLWQACFDGRAIVEDAWQRADGRFVDALRPNVEPAGFESIDAVRAARRTHLDAVRRMFEQCDVLVFTLGLTEAWRSRLDGTVYPLAPGVTAGSFDAARHEFVNFDVQAVNDDLTTFLHAVKAVNPRLRVLLTVSPVPLIATYEPRNALVATTYSKAVLRVAADMAYRAFDWVDYFPSFEIIAGNYAGAAYYEDDYRGIRDIGVDHVMRCFLRHYAGVDADAVSDPLAGGAAPVVPGEVVCDEEAIEQTRI